MDEDTNTYILCPHCGRYLHRSTVWRHQRDAVRSEAFSADLGQPDGLPLNSPPPSPEVPSLTSTEKALSDLHFSDLDDPWPHDDHIHNPSDPPPHNATIATELNDIEMGAEIHQGLGQEFRSQDHNVNVNTALIQPPPNDDPVIEEPDIDLLNANEPPPILPTAEEIFARARFGISDDDDNDDNNGVPLPDWMEEVLREIMDDALDNDDDLLSDPGMDLDHEMELNAARARKFLIFPII